MILSQTSPQGVPEDHVQLISCPSLILKNNHREDNFRRKKKHLLDCQFKYHMRGTRKDFFTYVLIQKFMNNQTDWILIVFLINFLMIRFPFTKGDQCFTSSPKPDELN